MRLKTFSSSDSQHTFIRLGERIKLARKAKKITLRELENRCGVHRTTLGRLESGDTTVSIAVLLAVLEVLGILSDLELIASSPTETDKSKKTVPQLDSDF
ncbi:MAG: helix-turn-helix transcriptional regulator [Cytophaga sp.]|nr:helix-turn-helix transcriptional regulator [Undibacterium sp.]